MATRFQYKTYTLILLLLVCSNCKQKEENPLQTENLANTKYNNAKQQYITIKDKVKIRQTAGIQGKVLLTLGKNKNVQFVEAQKETLAIAGIQGRWTKISYPPQKVSGWVFGGYIQKQYRKTMWVTAKTGIDLYDTSPSIQAFPYNTSNLPQGSQVEIIEEEGNIAKNLQTLGKWTYVYAPKLKQKGWVFAKYLSQKPPTQNTIALDPETGCYQFTRQTFPGKFQEACLGERDFCDGGVNSIYGKILHLDDQYIDYMLLHADGSAIVEVQDSFRYKRTFRNSKWYKRKDYILVKGEVLDSAFIFAIEPYVYGRECKTIQKIIAQAPKEPIDYDKYISICKQEWQEDIEKTFGKRSFYIDYSLKIRLNPEGNVSIDWQSKDPHKVPGKKSIRIQPRYIFTEKSMCLKPI
ncbi:MAG: hypothetical protein AAF518_17040 [Spirochaetota bacterium]